MNFPDTDVYREATERDVPALRALINLAFQAESFFKRGDRIDEPQLAGKFQTGWFYVLERNERLLGCVYLEVADAANPAIVALGDGAGYIGLLAVDPAFHGRGLGKMLMMNAEAELRRRGCIRVQLRIIHLRTELLGFYGRLGYRELGESPYPVPERTTMPVHFIDLEKTLT